MTESVSIIPISSLALILIPVAIVLWIQFKWSLDYKEGAYAVSRMLGQLLFIGYFLGYIFNTGSFWISFINFICYVSGRKLDCFTINKIEESRTF